MIIKRQIDSISFYRWDFKPTHNEFELEIYKEPAVTRSNHGDEF